jgi:hypothetical protein
VTKLEYVTVEPQDVERAKDALGFEAAEACAGCGKATPKTVTMDAVGWVVAFCFEERDKAIFFVGAAPGAPVHSVYCPDCAGNRNTLGTPNRD